MCHINPVSSTKVSSAVAICRAHNCYKYKILGYSCEHYCFISMKSQIQDSAQILALLSSTITILRKMKFMRCHNTKCCHVVIFTSTSYIIFRKFMFNSQPKDQLLHFLSPFTHGDSPLEQTTSTCNSFFICFNYNLKVTGIALASMLVHTSY